MPTAMKVPRLHTHVRLRGGNTIDTERGRGGSLKGLRGHTISKPKEMRGPYELTVDHLTGGRQKHIDDAGRNLKDRRISGERHDRELGGVPEHDVGDGRLGDNFGGPENVSNLEIR